MEGSRSGVAPAGAAELVASLRARGVALRAQGEALVVDAPADALTATDRERIRAEKPAILALLAQEGAAPRPRVSRAGPLPLGLVQQRCFGIALE